MKYCQVSHDGCSEFWKLCAGHLVEVIYNLVPGQRRSILQLIKRTLPLSVVAANSFAAASAEFDSSMAIVVVHASCYGHLVSPHCH